MPDRLDDVTIAFVAQLVLTFSQGEPAPALDSTLVRYVAYWRRTGASRLAVGAFVERLIARSRADLPDESAEGRALVERLREQVLARCREAYDAGL